ncbi:MAG: putative enoyl-CoA hydratase echA8 [Smithella sp. PtaU1.Bin162]|nr:MAG: putative enoyl-CoA hydratase echA8 [Smithella sp. PtaU1.Bin162]
MDYKTIILEKKNGYAVVKFNRTTEMNAINGKMRQELFEAFVSLEDDREVRSIILTGGEYVFSTGMDIKEMAALSDADVDEYFESMMKYLKKIYLCKKPVIAAVGGFALGGGFNLVVVCDLVIASESAIFCHPELKFGFNPLFHPLSQILGVTKAKEIVMLGEPIGANEALRIGLVNKVAPPERFMEKAETMAETMAKRSERAIGELKTLCNIVPHLDKISAIELEMSVCAKLFTRDERKYYMNEALFLEKLRKKKQK